MDCNLSLNWLINGKHVDKITNANGRFVYMPKNYGDPPAWEYIRFRVSEPNTDRLADAYDKAGYEGILPDSDLIPCIKDIYQYNHLQRKIGNDYVDRPYGDWINDQCCQCLNMTDDKGRMNLGDGFVVPSIGEQDCILRNLETTSIGNALYTCCPDIIPPLGALNGIADQIKSTMNNFYSIYKDAHNLYITMNPGAGAHPEENRIVIGDGFTVPSITEINNIISGMTDNSWSFAYAFSIICPDIIPPGDALVCIFQELSRPTPLPWGDVYRICHAEFTKKGKGNLWVYGIIGGLALFAFMRRWKT